MLKLFKPYAKFSYNPASTPEHMAASFVQHMTKGMGKEMETVIVSPLEFKIILETGAIVSKHSPGDLIEIEIWK